MSIFTDGDIGINIPTDVAIEGLEQSTTKKYKLLLINFRTMIRNVISSLDKDSNLRSVEGVIYEKVLQDINFLRTYMKNTHNLRVVVYLNSYTKLARKKHLKNALYKEPTTPKQIEYAQVEAATVEQASVAPGLIDLHIQDALSLTQKEGGQSDARALVITHVMTDLIDYLSFDKLDLLESHTGRIKSYVLWGDKLITGTSEKAKSLKSKVPFNQITLAVLGDGVYYKPFSRQLKEILFSMVIKHNLKASTTMERFLFVINNHGYRNDFKLFL